MPIPVLTGLPIVGPMILSSGLYLSVTIVLIGLIQNALFWTRWGLR